MARSNGAVFPTFRRPYLVALIVVAACGTAWLFKSYWHAEEPPREPTPAANDPKLVAAERPGELTSPDVPSANLGSANTNDSPSARAAAAPDEPPERDLPSQDDAPTDDASEADPPIDAIADDGAAHDADQSSPPDLPPPPIPTANDPTELDAPIVLSTNNQVVRLDRDYRAAETAIVVAAENVTIDGGGHVVEFNTAGHEGVMGIHIYAGPWSPADARLGNLPGAKRAKNVTIRNVVLREIEDAADSVGIGDESEVTAAISQCLVRVGGRDCRTLGFLYRKLSIADNVLIADQSATANRHQGPANVRGAKITARRNLLFGGNSGFVCASDSVVEDNLIAHASFVTNGYGVFLYKMNHVVVRNNLMLPLDGRGILLNAGGAADPPQGVGNRFEDNVILAWNRPNAEYGVGLNATGMRLRYWASDNRVTGNTILAVGGGKYAGASAIYLSCEQPDAWNLIRDNTAYAIVLGKPDTEHYAKAITFEGHVADDFEIAHNRFGSNHYLLSMSGTDGSGVQRRPLVDNEFAWIDGQAAVAAFDEAVVGKLHELKFDENPWALWAVERARAGLRDFAAAPLQPERKTFFSAYWKGDEWITLLSNTGSAEFDLSQIYVRAESYEGKRRFEVGRQCRVRAVRDGQPLIETELTVTTSYGRAFRCKTDDGGHFDLPVVAYWLGRRGNKADERYVKEANASLTVCDGDGSVTIAVDSIPEEIDLTDAPDDLPR